MRPLITRQTTRDVRFILDHQSVLPYLVIFRYLNFFQSKPYWVLAIGMFYYHNPKPFLKTGLSMVLCCLHVSFLFTPKMRTHKRLFHLLSCLLSLYNVVYKCMVSSPFVRVLAILGQLL